jgi:hypothetical protein
MSENFRTFISRKIGNPKRIPFKWGNANFKWSAIDPTEGKKYPVNYKVTGTNVWNDCALIVKLLGMPQPNEFLDRNLENKKRFIKILLEVQGKKYSQNKDVSKIKVSVQDVKLVAKEALGINVKIII